MCNSFFGGSVGIGVEYHYNLNEVYRVSTKKQQQQQQHKAPAVEFFVERATQCSACGGAGKTPNPLFAQLEAARAASAETWLNLAERHRVDPRDVQPDRPCSKCAGRGFVNFERVSLAEAIRQMGADKNVSE